MIGDMICPNGHQWFQCPVHHRICLGKSDHSKGFDECQCPGPQVKGTIYDYKTLDEAQSWHPSTKDIDQYNSSVLQETNSTLPSAYIVGKKNETNNRKKRH